MVIQWFKCLKNDGTQNSVTETNTLKSNFDKTEENVSALLNYIKAHNDYVTSKSAPKRKSRKRKQCATPTTPPQNASSQESNQGEASQERHLHNYEESIRRRAFRGDIEPFNFSQQESQSTIETIDDIVDDNSDFEGMDGDLQEDEDLEDLDECISKLLPDRYDDDGNMLPLSEQWDDHVEEFQAYLDEDVEANGEGGIDPSEEMEPDFDEKNDEAPGLAGEGGEYKIKYEHIPDNIADDDYNFYSSPPENWAPEEDEIRKSVPTEVFENGAFSTFAYVSGFD